TNRLVDVQPAGHNQHTRQVAPRNWRSQLALKRLLLVKGRDPRSYHEMNSPLLRSGSVLSRNLWTDATAVAPSPIAKATRFGLPLRQSPTANTPGRLVSTEHGGLSSFHT